MLASPMPSSRAGTMSACHTVSQLGLGVEADWAFPHLLCCPKLSMLLPVSRKLHRKRRVGSRRARHNAASFAWTEVPIPPECKSLRTTLVPSWSLGRGSSPIARTSHLRRKGSEERKSPPTRGTGTCQSHGPLLACSYCRCNCSGENVLSAPGSCPVCEKIC